MPPFQRYVWMIFIMITAQCQSELRLQMAPKVNSRILPKQFVLSTLVKRLRNRPSLEKTNCRPRIPGSFVQKMRPNFNPLTPHQHQRPGVFYGGPTLALQYKLQVVIVFIDLFVVRQGRRWQVRVVANVAGIPRTRYRLGHVPICTSSSTPFQFMDI